jgi:hypothetical protein
MKETTELKRLLFGTILLGLATVTRERKGEEKMHYRAKNLKGYGIGATGGDIGKEDDFPMNAGSL